MQWRCSAPFAWQRKHEAIVGSWLRRREIDVPHRVAALARGLRVLRVCELERRRRQVELLHDRARRPARMTGGARGGRRALLGRVGSIDRVTRTALALGRDQIVDRRARRRAGGMAARAQRAAREVLGVRERQRQPLQRINDRRPVVDAVIGLDWLREGAGAQREDDGEGDPRLHHISGLNARSSTAITRVWVP